MKMGKHSKKRQPGSTHGRPVLVTFYVTRPRRKDGGSVSTATASSRNVHRHHHDVHHHHHHHHHHHLHGGSSDEEARQNPRSYDRRLDLLEYSRQLRATAATPPPQPKPVTPRRNTKTTVGYGDQVPQPKPPAPAAADGRRLVRRRLERASSQHISQSCLGGNWSWKRVLTLVLPCHGSTHQSYSSTSTRTRTNRRDDKDGKYNSKSKSWPAAVELVSKLKVDRRRSRSRRSSTDDNGLVKKLFSMFRQQSRSTL